MGFLFLQEGRWEGHSHPHVPQAQLKMVSKLRLANVGLIWGGRALSQIGRTLGKRLGRKIISRHSHRSYSLVTQAARFVLLGEQGLQLRSKPCSPRTAPAFQSKSKHNSKPSESNCCSLEHIPLVTEHGNSICGKNLQQKNEILFIFLAGVWPKPFTFGKRVSNSVTSFFTLL